jgi:hypothetical protein
MEWVLKHDRDLSKWLWKHKLEYTGPWALQNINYYYDNRNRDHDMEAPAEEKIEWTMRNLHGALMMNVDTLGTWIFLGFIHAKRLSS